MHEIKSKNSLQTLNSDLGRNKGKGTPLSGIYILHIEHKENRICSLNIVPFWGEGESEGTI